MLVFFSRFVHIRRCKTAAGAGLGEALHSGLFQLSLYSLQMGEPIR